MFNIIRIMIVGFIISFQTTAATLILEDFDASLSGTQPPKISAEGYEILDFIMIDDDPNLDDISVQIQTSVNYVNNDVLVFEVTGAEFVFVTGGPLLESVSGNSNSPATINYFSASEDIIAFRLAIGEEMTAGDIYQLKNVKLTNITESVSLGYYAIFNNMLIDTSPIEQIATLSSQFEGIEIEQPLDGIISTPARKDFVSGADMINGDELIFSSFNQGADLLAVTPQYLEFKLFNKNITNFDKTGGMGFSFVDLSHSSGLTISEISPSETGSLSFTSSDFPTTDLKVNIVPELNDDVFDYISAGEFAAEIEVAYAYDHDGNGTEYAIIASKASPVRFDSEVGSWKYNSALIDAFINTNSDSNLSSNNYGPSVLSHGAISVSAQGLELNKYVNIGSEPDISSDDKLAQVVEAFVYLDRSIEPRGYLKVFFEGGTIVNDSVSEISIISVTDDEQGDYSFETSALVIDSDESSVLFSVPSNISMLGGFNYRLKGILIGEIAEQLSLYAESYLPYGIRSGKTNALKMLEVNDQFSVEVSQKFDAKIDVSEGRLQFLENGGITNSDKVIFSLQDSSEYLSTTLVSAEFEIKGENFDFLLDEAGELDENLISVSGLNQNSIINSELDGDVLTVSATSVPINSDIEITLSMRDPEDELAVELTEQSFSWIAQANYNYDHDGSGTRFDNGSSAYVIADEEIGSWNINDSVLRIPHYVMSGSSTSFVYATNKTQRDVEVYLTAFSESGTQYSAQHYLITVAANSVQNITSSIEAALLAEGAMSDEILSLTLYVDVSDTSQFELTVGNNERGDRLIFQ